jgi:hypothetical protein
MSFIPTGSRCPGLDGSAGGSVEAQRLLVPAQHLEVLVLDVVEGVVGDVDVRSLPESSGAGSHRGEVGTRVRDRVCVVVGQEELMSVPGFFPVLDPAIPEARTAPELYALQAADLLCADYYHWVTPGLRAGAR